MDNDLNPESILVYVGRDPDNALGENLIKLPFLRALREAYPGAHITWMHGPGPWHFAGSLKPLAEGLIDEFLADPGMGESASFLWPWQRRLGRRFDLVIDTQRRPQATLDLRKLAARRFISQTWGGLFSDRRAPADFAGATLLSERLLALVAAAAGRAIRPSHRVVLPGPWVEAAEMLLPDGPVYVGFAPGAGRKDYGKCWPLDRFFTVAREQAAKGRLPVFIIGPEEKDWLARIREEAPDAVLVGPDAVEWPAGARRRLAEGRHPVAERLAKPADVNDPVLVVALAGRMAAAVANCSGVGHMLAAGGAAMVSLYGPTNPDKFAPYTPHLTVLSARMFGGGGIEAIPARAVVEALDAHLAGGAGSLAGSAERAAAAG